MCDRRDGLCVLGTKLFETPFTECVAAVATTKGREAKLRKLRQRAKGSPENSHKWWDYARFLARECNRPAELIRAIERLIALLPEVDFRRKMGCAYIAKGDLAKGVGLIKASLAEHPDAKGFMLLASECVRNDMFAEAQEACRQAIRLDPGCAKVYFLMGEATKPSSWEDAICWYRRAVQIDADYEKAWRQIGSCLVKDRETAVEGVAALRRALDLDPKDRWAHILLANGLWKLRHIEEAKSQYERTVALFPDYRPFRRWQNQFLQWIGQDKARGVSKKRQGIG